MKFFLIFVFIFILSCSTNKVVKNHGVLSLESKSKKIHINKSNANDIISILGPPSTKSTFDENTWIYVESTKVNQSIIKLGKNKIEKNNVLVVQLNNRGILKKKDFYDLQKMNDLKFSESVTKKKYANNSFVYTFLTSLREKINAPTRRKDKN